MYRFRQIDEERRLYTTSKLLLPDTVREQQFVQLGKYGEYWAWVRGALLTLFGEPLLDGGDTEYLYLLEATDGSEANWTLTAYEGASGAAIGGDPRDQSVYPVASYLQQLIDTTLPKDFEVTRYNDEYGTTTTYGCKDGIPYYYEERGDVARATSNLQEREYQEYVERHNRLRAELGSDYCMSCEGSGKCFLCTGKGGIEQIRGYDKMGNPLLYPPPYPECPECAGNGVCQVCAGTGKA